MEDFFREKTNFEECYGLANSKENIWDMKEPLFWTKQALTVKPKFRRKKTQLSPHILPQGCHLKQEAAFLSPEFCLHASDDIKNKMTKQPCMSVTSESTSVLHLLSAQYQHCCQEHDSSFRSLFAKKIVEFLQVSRRRCTGVIVYFSVFQKKKKSAQIQRSCYAKLKECAVARVMGLLTKPASPRTPGNSMHAPHSPSLLGI